MIKFEKYKKLQPIALEILNTIVKRKLSYVEEINMVGDIIKVLENKTT